LEKMKSSKYARIFAEVMRQHEPKPRDISLSRSDREAEIELIRDAMARRKRHKNVLLGASAGAAAALVVVASLTWLSSRTTSARLAPVETSTHPNAPARGPVVVAIASGSGAIVAAPGSSEPAVTGRTLSAGSRLIVDSNEGAKLALSTGTRLAVHPGSQLAVVEDGRTQIFALNAGSLQADVAKLRQDERFLVRTTDAEIEVRGTAFLVDIVAPERECGEGTTTRVTVSEGVVVVRSQGRENAVRAGEKWPRGCRTIAATPSTPHHVASKRPTRFEATAPTLGSPSTKADTTATPHVTTQPSTLAEENNLFAEGVFARKNGQLTVALSKMDRLLEAYPSGHLAENASAERMRLLRVLDPARAAVAAREYVRQYPTGFARGDAESILAGR
jgi:ferric-dicitrate binding protein FerR (iron transport regulator)